MSSRVALYSAVDEELTHYEVDVAGAALVRRKSVKTPANIQYAWPHPSRRFLYAATSNRGAGLKADFNHIGAYRIDPASGELTQHGEPQVLPHRAVHICVDATGSQGRKVFGGGENTITSFTLDEKRASRRCSSTPTATASTTCALSPWIPRAA